MTKQPTKTDNLPAGFGDISKRVRSTMVGRYTKYTDEDGVKHTVKFNEEQTKAVSYILSHVVKHNGAFLTCFANNKPILNNDLETTIDACAMHMALTRLLVVDECYSQSGMAMETFKPIVSEDYVEVERKQEARFQTRATHNTIIFSNHHVPFKSGETERRWWVPSYRHYDLGSDDKDVNQAFHAWGNQEVRKALPLDERGDQSQLVDLLHWLKLVADNTPKSFFTKAPKSVGFVDLLDVEVGQAQDHFMDWLDGLQPQDAFTLANVVAESGIAQSEMKKVLGQQGLRSCQWKKHGNRKHWTKAPHGTSPSNLVEYRAA